jgi:hypothetical protein
MNMTAFWNMAPCSVVEVDRRFAVAHCLHYLGDDQDVVVTLNEVLFALVTQID